ncbi:hypothetical protein Leryth_006806 [Lithospermum erythrorhizon]|uniref:Protein BZR1 homolog n=1 Tax=Lithospermum erythrorhizon TaxID=34254 RepID=A0AAV3R0K1_LITER|nr:hypothetical protein Leryth_006806 [Lithospermum erythrorhizon]
MDEEKSGRRGCIRTSKGPWKVRRATKDGKTSTKLRYPSERERQNNKERERKRRATTHNIFAGLRAHGNFPLPKHADSNDLLMALCREAGWHVEEDGTIYKKNVSPEETPSVVIVEPPCQVSMEEEEEGYCKCNEHCTTIINNNPQEQCYIGQQLGQIIVADINNSSSSEVDLSLSL